MAICLMQAHGNPMATFQCAMQFVACAKEKCNEVEVTLVSNGDVIEKLKEVKTISCVALLISLKKPFSLQPSLIRFSSKSRIIAKLILCDINMYNSNGSCIFLQCKEANDKCMAGADSIKAKAMCYMTYGVCIGKDLAECAGPVSNSPQKSFS